MYGGRAGGRRGAHGMASCMMFPPMSMGVSGGRIGACRRREGPSPRPAWGVAAGGSKAPFLAVRALLGGLRLWLWRQAKEIQRLNTTYGSVLKNAGVTSIGE